jgi:hypothetical protein
MCFYFINMQKQIAEEVDADALHWIVLSVGGAV